MRLYFFHSLIYLFWLFFVILFLIILLYLYYLFILIFLNFRLLSSFSRTLGEDVSNEDSVRNIWNRINANDDLSVKMKERTTVFQVYFVFVTFIFGIGYIGNFFAEILFFLSFWYSPSSTTRNINLSSEIHIYISIQMQTTFVYCRLECAWI